MRSSPYTQDPVPCLQRMYFVVGNGRSRMKDVPRSHLSRYQSSQTGYLGRLKSVRYLTTGAVGPTADDDAGSGTTKARVKVEESKAAAFVRPRMVAATSIEADSCRSSQYWTIIIHMTLGGKREFVVAWEVKESEFSWELRLVGPSSRVC